MSVSLIMITLNAEAHLERSLASVAWVDELVIVDGGSSDRTLEIAQSFGAKIHVLADWPGFGKQKNRALDLAQGDWIISLDADEVLSDELSQELQSLLFKSSSQHQAYCLPRLSNFCGRWMHHGSWWPDPVLRVFRREQGRFIEAPIHEYLEINPGVSIGHCQHVLLHYSYDHFEQVLAKMNSYSTTSANWYAQKKVNNGGGVLQALLRSYWTFLRCYLFKAGFLDGRYGFLNALAQAHGNFYKYVKLMHLREKK
jgi:glycosyltransferase involved in cell wall biosynthesis